MRLSSGLRSTLTLGLLTAFGTVSVLWADDHPTCPADALQRSLRALQVAERKPAQANVDVIRSAHEIPSVPLKDQCDMNSCWLFAGVTEMEHDQQALHGVPRALSAEYLIGGEFLDFIRGRALNGLDELGIQALREGNLPMPRFAIGGSLEDVTKLARQHGVIPEGTWKPRTDIKNEEFVEAIRAVLRPFYFEAVKLAQTGRTGSDEFRLLRQTTRQKLETLMAERIGPLTERFEYEGKTYTPQEFATAHGYTRPRKWLKIDEREMVRPDFANEVERKMVRALGTDRSVTLSLYWDADHPGGVIDLPSAGRGRDVDAYVRKVRRRRDIHVVQVVGYMRDRGGRIEFWKVQNSHGTYDLVTRAYLEQLFAEARIPLPE